MEPLVNLAEASPTDVRVYLRGGDIGPSDARGTFTRYRPT
jgi:hypothetical protein